MIRESRVEKYFTKQVQAIGGKSRKWVCPGYRGAPDRIALFPWAKIFFVELKRPKGGRLSTQQKRFHDMLRLMGFEVRVLKNMAEVDLFINTVKTVVAPTRVGYGDSLLKNGVIEGVGIPGGF